MTLHKGDMLENKMKKYGLQLRATSSQRRNTHANFTVPSAFGNEDEDVASDISRQAGKNKAAKDVEQQHKRALADDPSVFDYDGVYCDMKEKKVLAQVQDVQERKPKYISALIQKAKEREREHDVIYECKLARERSKEDELYSDKDKFVTGAYKKKLVEQAKWLEEERIRQLREEKDDVTRKDDLSDFYYNLSRNIAFGGRKAGELSKLEAPPVEDITSRRGEEAGSLNKDEDMKILISKTESEMSSEAAIVRASSDMGGGDDSHRYNRHAEEVSAARERFLARKRARLEMELVGSSTLL